MNFEIIGKMGNNSIYKNTRGDNSFAVWQWHEADLQGKAWVYADERLITWEFYPYADFFYMISNTRKENIVHCNASELERLGKRLSEPVETWHITHWRNEQ